MEWKVNLSPPMTTILNDWLIIDDDKVNGKIRFEATTKENDQP